MATLWRKFHMSTITDEIQQGLCGILRDRKKKFAKHEESLL
jgi:hypothetical protein